MKRDDTSPAAVWAKKQHAEEKAWGAVVALALALLFTKVEFANSTSTTEVT